MTEKRKGRKVNEERKDRMVIEEGRTTGKPGKKGRTER